MRKNHRYHATALWIAPTLVVAGLAIFAQWVAVGDSVDKRIRDAFLRLSPTSTPRITPSIPDVAVVTIDPRSLRATEAWPWPRSMHAEAVDRLGSAGARAIAFDIDFSSASTPELDERFAASLHRSERVVLAAFSQREQLDNGAEFEVANLPIAILGEAASGLGSVLVPIDADGVVRHAPRTSRINGKDIPSLARAALRVAVPPDLLDRMLAVETSRTDTRIDYRRALPPIPTVAFIDLVEGRFDPSALSGRAVFVGATAAEFQDLWATPREPALPGVMIQAIAYRTAAAEAMGEDVLVPVDPTWQALAFIAVALAMLPRKRQGVAGRGFLFVGAALSVVALSWFCLWEWGIESAVSVPLGLIAAQYALGIETLQKRIRTRADAQESSLNALARIGDSTRTPACRIDVEHGPEGSLALALELLGEVVSARGVVLLRARPNLSFRDERLEWWPDARADSSLDVDREEASRSLQERRLIETQPLDTGARAIYSPLVAGSEPIGVLVVFCDVDQTLDALHRRTIATVGAQLALTAQNLQLIDRLRETFESSIAAVAGAVEARDGYTDQHCRRLAAFSSLMGSRLGMPDTEIRAMELGALLHDVGKIGVPDAILNKPGRLTDEERCQMQRHPEIGAGIVGPVVGLEQTTLDCVIHHHERWDGEGYPEGLEEDEIPLAARIVSIVDVWDALSTARPYKAAYTQPEVRDRLLKGRGTQFDPELVDLFFEVLEEQGAEMLELVARSSADVVLS